MIGLEKHTEYFADLTPEENAALRATALDEESAFVMLENTMEIYMGTMRSIEERRSAIWKQIKKRLSEHKPWPREGVTANHAEGKLYRKPDPGQTE